MNQQTTDSANQRTYEQCHQWENFDWNEVLHAEGIIPQLTDDNVTIGSDSDILVQLAESTMVTAQTLSTLVFNPSIEVRKAVADNPRTPYRALMMLVFDVCPEVRFQVAENRNVPDWVLQVLIEDESPYVRWCALNTLNEKMR